MKIGIKNLKDICKMYYKFVNLGKYMQLIAFLDLAHLIPISINIAQYFIKKTQNSLGNYLKKMISLILILQC